MNRWRTRSTNFDRFFIRIWRSTRKWAGQWHPDWNSNGCKWEYWRWNCYKFSKKYAKKRNKFQWTIDSEWDDLDKALDFLENEGFVNYDFSDLKCGLKFYFRCKLVPKQRKEWCGKRYTLYLPSNNKQILILRNENDHDHDKVLEGTVRPPSDEIEEFIIDLFKCGTTKVGDVIGHLDYAREKKGIFKSEKNPGKRQIEYLLKKFRKTEVPPIIKLGDMIKWCEQNSKLPSDVNEGFVIGSKFSSFDDDLSFSFAVSTPLKCCQIKKPFALMPHIN